MKCFAKISVSCILTVLSLPGLGKSGPEHVRDMHKVFGIPQSRSQINQLFQSITQLMDNREVDLTFRLRQVVRGYTEGSYTHRIYFHWGFNGAPEDSLALADRLKVANASEQEKLEFYGILKEVQRRRNQKVLLNVQLCCNSLHDRSKALSRQEMNAIATLGYDTHLLGDYIEGKTIKALMPMDRLVKDICNVFDNIKKGDKKFRANPEQGVLLRGFKREMKVAALAQSQSEAAGKMLNIMIDKVPKLLRLTDRLQNVLQIPDDESKDRVLNTSAQ